MFIESHFRLGDDVLSGAEDCGIVLVVGVRGAVGGEQVDAHERRVEQRRAHSERLLVGGHERREPLRFSALGRCAREVNIVL